MKMLEGKRRLSHAGFINPDKVHTITVNKKPEETAALLLQYLKEQHYCEDILFPYNFGWVLTLLYTFTFAYSMLSVIDELLT